MAVTVQQITQLKNYYTQDLYVGLRGQQKTDQSYIDDTFLVLEVRPPHTPIRSGIGYQVVSAPAEQVITSNPQAFISVALKGEEKSADNISKEINEVWIPNLSRQIPNIFKESVKNKLSRGESYIQVVHNEKWVTKEQERYGMPIIFMAPDPMVIYGSPEEDDCGWTPNVGVPNRVIVFYEKQPMDVILRYPSWTNPLKRGIGEDKKLVQWFEYWDKDVRYFEADGVAMLKGSLQKNDYGFVPFVRKYSGFGKRSPSGNLEELIVSDIRRSRDLIREECSIRSDIASIMHIFAHKPVTIILPDGTEINEDQLRKNFDMGSYSLNLLYLPEGSDIKWGDTIMPTPEAFQHLRDIRNEIQQKHPFIMAGFPMGSSGRQQDMSQMAAAKRYDTIVENTEDEFATAFEMGVKILGEIPKLMPSGLNKDDLKINYKCEVLLKAEDPIEKDRTATLGSRLFETRQIDIRTNHVKYQGYTEEQSEEIIDNMIVDDVTLNDPMWRALMGRKAAQKLGLAAEIEELQAEMQGGQMGGQPAGRGSEVKTPQGREMVDMALTEQGQRNPPERYFRSGR